MTQAVDVFLLGRKKFHYLTDNPPRSTDSKYADERAEDAQIRSFLWKSMESKVSCNLVCAKLVWEQAKELYSSVNNLRCIYNL